MGGGTQSAEWLQIVSDVGGIDQVIPKIAIGASYGDAFLAGIAAGLLKREDIGQWAEYSGTLRSREQTHKVYDRLYTDYLQLYQATREIVHRLSSAPDPTHSHAQRLGRPHTGRSMWI